jgi:hypothetical protein
MAVVFRSLSFVSIVRPIRLIGDLSDVGARPKN